LSIHKLLISRVKEKLSTEGYNIIKPLFGDISAERGNEFLIVEVKPIDETNTNLSSILHGTGQLLYYRFRLFGYKPNIKLALAVSHNEEKWKRYGKSLDKLRAKVEPFLSSYGIDLMVVEVD